MKRDVDILIDDNTDIIKEVKNRIDSNLKCIFVDEAQLFPSDKIDELYIVSKIFDVPVICYGLRTNFKMKGFSGSTRLLEIADSLEEIKSICKCGNIARFNARKVNGKYTLDGDDIIIDGTDSKVEYIPLCGDCYLKKVKKIDYKSF